MRGFLAIVKNVETFIEDILEDVDLGLARRRKQTIVKTGERKRCRKRNCSRMRTHRTVATWP